MNRFATQPSPDEPDARLYVGLGLLSAAALAFEVVLTRLFSLSQGYHFSFLAISMALLGGGASGTFLTLRPSAAGRERTRLGHAALLFAVTAPAAIVAVNLIPFDAYLVAWERAQFLWLALYILTLSAPFFFQGLVIGGALAAWPTCIPRLYAANLVGGGAGPLLALAGLNVLGGPGTVFLTAALGAVAAMAINQIRRPVSWAWVAGWVPLLLVPLFLWSARYPPGMADVRLTPHQPLSQGLLYPGSRVIWQKWNSFSRVDVVESPGIRSAPGLSLAYPGDIPPQLGLAVDGQNISAITQVAPEDAGFCTYLPVSLPFLLRPQADTLVLEPGGGLAVLAGLSAGAGSITAVSANPAVVEAVTGHGQGVLVDPRVTAVVDESRSFLRRQPERYDLILLPLTDSFRPVTAGAYTLGEDYRYTVESFAELWDRLQPNGILAAERWLQMPPSESLRLWATLLTALRGADVSQPEQHLIALGSMQTSLIMAGRQPFSPEELEEIRHLAEKQQLDIIYMPGLPMGERDQGVLAGMGVNRYSVVPGAPYYTTFTDLLATPDPGRFYSAHEYAVDPPCDDRPFFFHLFKWRQVPSVLTTLGKTWQPFGGAGYLVLLVLLVTALLLSSGLILLPLAVRGRGGRESRVSTTPSAGRHQVDTVGGRGGHNTGRYLVFFTFLGMGFMLVEIPLLGRFIGFLGQSAIAFAVVVSGLLVASGAGSQWLSPRLPLKVSLPLLAGLVVVYAAALGPLFGVALGLPLGGRALVAWLALFPLGLLLGTPFPSGMSIANKHAPGLIPWFWAVNGCASVVAAVLAPMLALDLGFRVVLYLAAAAYLGAFVVLGHGKPKEKHSRCLVKDIGRKSQ